MMQMQFKMTFSTPAFLGDAERKGAMRSPPIKALIRHFWRIAVAKSPSVGYDPSSLREEEGRLFGHASLKENGENWASRSLVRIKLGAWEAKTIEENLPAAGTVFHREAGHGGRDVEACLYLGYGPIDRNSHLKFEKALATGKDGGTTLSIALPDDKRESLTNTMKLIQAFGTVGGRSRNGWGSLCLQGEGLPDAYSLIKEPAFIKDHSLPLAACLRRDWPHAIGTDSEGKALIWATKQPRGAWPEVIKDLAQVKVAFRTGLPFKGGSGPMEKRHVLAYPVTSNHKVHAWKNDARLPNQMRFKVIERPDGRLQGIAFHIPCAIPTDVGTVSFTAKDQMDVWKEVHRNLDQLMRRI